MNVLSMMLKYLPQNFFFRLAALELTIEILIIIQFIIVQFIVHYLMYLYITQN